METPSGMLNAIGLENVGVQAFIREKLPPLQDYDTHVIANIFGKTVGEFLAITRLLNPEDHVSALELNISCPNIKQGGVEFGHRPELTFEVVEAVKSEAEKPVWVKLSPNVTDIGVFARACEDAGADAITLVNTFVGMSVDIYRRRPMLSNETGGLSGPAIRPLAVRLVREVAQTVRIPVVGIGGISTVRDALEFLIAGARAVQIGTANFFNPRVSVKVIRDLQFFCQQNSIPNIGEIIGSLSTPPTIPPPSWEAVPETK